MITMEEAVELGMEIFVDDRRKCGDCQHYKANAWKGICGANRMQFKEIAHRCAGYEEKRKKKELLVGDKFWE